MTWFFRDPTAFDALGDAIDRSLLDRSDPGPFRVWVPGCATGEEALSVAIVVHERLERAGRPPAVQVFATDLDADAIRVARTGRYPATVALRIGPERFTRWFTVDGDTCQVVPSLRECVVYGAQNVVSEAPFNRLDLLSCRNLLLYLDAEAQRRLLALFHYALQPQGLLFLGNSESVDGRADLFDTVDARARVYRNRDTSDSASALVPRHGGWHAPSVTTQGSLAPAVRARFDELLLQELVPPTVVLHRGGDILFVHGRTGRFLEPIEGPQRPHNLFEMAREGLPAMLQTMVREAGEAPGRDVVRQGVRVVGDEGESTVDLQVRYVQRPDLPNNGVFLATFAAARPLPPAEGVDHRIVELDREVQRIRREHHLAMIDLARANDDLRSTNDDLQCANEELQTSREEMRALNDELQALNGVLGDKLGELSRSQEVARDLLEATGLPLVYLDEELRVVRFTEAATCLYGLRATDLGRPLTELASSLRYRELVDDLKEVMRTQRRFTRLVRAEDGARWRARVIPSSALGGFVLLFERHEEAE